MGNPPTNAELESYIDEDLAPDQMTRIEEALREDPQLLEVIVALNRRRDTGVHSVGAIWRRNRISCPTREQLGSFLLQALGDDHAQYIEFHIETIGCRVCLANLDDLYRQQQEDSHHVDYRRRKYFQSSAGYLKRKK